MRHHLRTLVVVLVAAGLLALFLTILFVVKGTSMFPATAALAWAVLAYICVDFGFLDKLISITASDQMYFSFASKYTVGAPAAFRR